MSEGNQSLAASAASRLNVSSPALGTIGSVPTGPGLYSLSTSRELAIADLGLKELEPDEPLTARILYLGKAEDSIAKRLAGTHFTTGKTGHSTVRRTFGALLGLSATTRPSTIASPTRKQLMTMTANFAFTRDDDSRLSDWMLANLEIRAFEAVVPWLGDLERAVGAALRPPLDQELKPLWTPNPWRSSVASARERMRLALRTDLGLD